MARLRINQGINLTLDASTTDFIVKSLSGPNNSDLMLNARNYGIEIRIDEDNSGNNTFRITKGSGGSITLLELGNNGSLNIRNTLNIGGFDLSLGTFDQVARGNSGPSRALVKDHNATLAINYVGDFVSGVRVDGPGLGIGGTNYVYNTNPSFQIPGADNNAKWLIIRDTASGSGVVSFNNTKDADGNILGSLVWTREGGQIDGHRQVAGIVAAQSGTGAIAGAELRFYTKGSAQPVQRMVINRGGFVGINNTNPDYRLTVEESIKNIAVYIRKTNNGNGGDGSLNGPALLVENSYGNHSWGNLAEFRIGNNGGLDPPNITFTAGWASTGWSIGMAGSNDADFGIVSNRGWRFNSLGTLQLRVKPDGQLITRGTITPGVSSGFAGHINSSNPIKFVNGSAAQEIYVRKIRASASWATNDANDPGDGGGFFSGNLIVNGSTTSSRFISTAPTGTPPLQVSSTTKVNNLNADLLDGYDTSTGATANTVAVRDSNGYLVASGLLGSGSFGLLINARNSGIELRIDEDGVGDDVLKVTKGFNGSSTLLFLDNSGNFTVPGVILARYDHTNRFVVQSYLTPSSITISAAGVYTIASINVYVPSGKSLYLKRVRWASGLLPRIFVSSASSWTGSSGYGDTLLDISLASGNNSERNLNLALYNQSSNPISSGSGFGIWAEFEIR